MTVNQAAVKWGVSAAWVRKLIADQRIPAEYRVVAGRAEWDIPPRTKRPALKLGRPPKAPSA